MATTNVNIRVDEDVKATAETIYRKLGFTLSTAVNMFLRQSILADGLPFDVRLRPNADTLAAMKETDDILSGRKQVRQYASAQELFDELDAEMDENEC